MYPCEWQCAMIVVSLQLFVTISNVTVTSRYWKRKFPAASIFNLQLLPTRRKKPAETSMHPY